MESIKKSILLIVVFTLVSITGNTQFYEDYIGAGHSQGIEVTTSDNHQYFGWSQTASGQSTLDGSGMDARYFETARFLSQATLGASATEVAEVAAMVFEDWIEYQAAIPPTNILPQTEEIHEYLYQIFLDNGGDPNDFFRASEIDFSYAWWQVNLTNQDLLRQRIALALSEILVVSFNSDLSNAGYGVADYYDIFLNNAFGNYKDILTEVTNHPAMGYYLSHYNNPKAVPEENIHPDENYAREIMQLFTIGLYELNNDGTYVLDGDGNPIPTYDNDDIKEYAKVFTGLGIGAVRPEFIGEVEPDFGVDIWFTDMRVPMTMYPEWHDSGPKSLLNGVEIPAGMNPVSDINTGIESLFNHPNMGPFLARRLIQSLVKSNPTPGYIDRVASAFNDNGQGVRGDMLAVIKAILLDEEARNCEWINDSDQGKLREPMVRYISFTRSLNLFSEDEFYWNIGYDFYEKTKQLPMSAPSVFNFFLPDFQPVGEMEDAGLYGPEFQIHNSLTSIGYVNSVYDWVWYNYIIYSWEDGIADVFADYSDLYPLAKDPEVLINKLDKMFTHGQLTPETRAIIKDAMLQITSEEYWENYLEFRAKMGIYLIMISPDYNILK